MRPPVAFLLDERQPNAQGSIPHDRIMNDSKKNQWERFQKFYFEFPAAHLAVDTSRMTFPDDYFPAMEARIQKAFRDMAALEGGSIANSDEDRMVGHYWLRKPALAPTPQIRQEIEDTIIKTQAFAKKIHSGSLQGQSGSFRNYLLIGIGGSALGPQFVANALGDPSADRFRPHFLDNTDPDGIQRVVKVIGDDLGRTLCLVISKSGSTKETRNGMLEVRAQYEARGLKFEKHCVAITQQGSQLSRIASDQGWIEQFPMWDWVGGRTSELSAVGLLPAALQGIDIDQILAGAKACDELTRLPNVQQNPAAQLALAWFHAGGGVGDRNMVILPYKDRLELFSKYLQQLVMESLGKEFDLHGRPVRQGLTVFGNKGSTDQHSYIQQLRDGPDDYFAVFVEVLHDQEGAAISVEDGLTSGDYLQGFFLGTRQALFDKGRQSITVTVERVNGFAIGVLIALFERSVGLYASLINVNAYHQPGVEAGKKAAASVLELQRKIVACLKKTPSPMTVEEIAMSIHSPDAVEHVFKVCEHLVANRSRGLSKTQGDVPAKSKYQFVAR
jgi:glucose-6-phosphate isomerase